MKNFKLRGKVWAYIEIEVAAENAEAACDKVYAMDVAEIIDKAEIYESDVELDEEEEE